MNNHLLCCVEELVDHSATDMSMTATALIDRKNYLVTILCEDTYYYLGDLAFGKPLLNALATSGLEPCEGSHWHLNTAQEIHLNAFGGISHQRQLALPVKCWVYVRVKGPVWL